MPHATLRGFVRPILDEAMRAAGDIENRDGQAALLAHITVLRHRAGDLAGGARALAAALAAAGDIDDGGARALALARVAREQAQTGDRDGAGRTAGLAVGAARAVVESAERAAASAEIAEMALDIDWGGGPAVQVAASSSGSRAGLVAVGSGTGACGSGTMVEM